MSPVTDPPTGRTAMLVGALISCCGRTYEDGKKTARRDGFTALRMLVRVRLEA